MNSKKITAIAAHESIPTCDNSAQFQGEPIPFVNIHGFNDEQTKLFNELDRNGKRKLLKSLKGKKKYGFK